MGLGRGYIGFPKEDLHLMCFIQLVQEIEIDTILAELGFYHRRILFPSPLLKLFLGLV
jgi:hypothetical protein